MQRLQRKIGVFMPRVPNEADIESMLSDFNDSDQMLEKIESAAKAWRDAWTDILSHQLNSVEHFHTLYKPLGAKGGDYSSHVAAETPPETLQRCEQLHVAFTELKTDMAEELADVERKLVNPAKLARDALKPMKKTIKERDKKKVDYERYKSRAETLQRKQNRSDRDNIALNKHEVDLAKATHDYEFADEVLRSQLPRLNAATFSLLPHLLANQIVLQNNLIGNLYTVLHQYSNENGYPDPPPEPEEVIPVWDGAFTSLRKEMENGFDLLRTGKAIHQPMRLPDQGATLTGLGIRNKVIPGRRASSQTTVPTVHGTSPRIGHSLSTPSESGLSKTPSYGSLASRPKIGGHSPGLSPNTGNENAWSRRTSNASSASVSTSGHDDYFGRNRLPSTASSGSATPNPAAGKKKPPPPPPKKIGSFHSEYVVAMYDFAGEGAGDLSFNADDRIRVVKKTNSSHDWWEGELNGRTGSFPANYCK